MLNKVMIIGRLGRDPEVRYMQNGAPVATLNVATDESYTDRDGNKVDRTEWHRVTVFNKTAENCGNYLTKGSLVYVEGSLQTRKWQDQQGQDRYTTEIRAQRVQFLDRKGERGPAEEGWQGSSKSWSNAVRDNKQSEHRQNSGADEDMGPAFPSEAAMNQGANNGGGNASMDEVPF